LGFGYRKMNRVEPKVLGRWNAAAKLGIQVVGFACTKRKLPLSKDVEAYELFDHKGGYCIKTTFDID